MPGLLRTRRCNTQMNVFFLTLLTALALSSYYFGTSKARLLSAEGTVRLRSLPHYHGTFAFLSAMLPAVILAAVWIAIEPIALRNSIISSISAEYLSGKDVGIVLTEVKNVARGALSAEQADPAVVEAATHFRATQSAARWAFWCTLVAVAAVGAFLSLRKISVTYSARAAVEVVFRATLFISSCVAVLTTVGIVGSLIFESIRFFERIPITEFLFGVQWSPQIAMRSDQVASQGAFGSLALLAGTCLIAAIAMSVAVPVGLFSAIYLTEYANKKVRATVKPILEILAGIPTVVYGFFAVVTVAPVVRSLGMELGLEVSAESALAAGLVMGIMIIPFISSLSDDVIHAVPQTLRDGSYALGATKSETIKQVILPAALPGIMGAILLAMSRAIGETMIVVMAAGLSANLTINPLENVTTVTVQIVTILIGDQEFDSSKTLAAFALGLQLFCLTLVLNVAALQIVKRYREKYE